MPSTRPDRNAARPCANITATWSGPRPSRQQSPPRPPSRTPSRRRSSAQRVASEDPGDHQPKNDEEDQEAENRERQFAENGVAARHHGHNQNDDERNAEGDQGRVLEPEPRREGIAVAEAGEVVKTGAADDDEPQDPAVGVSAPRCARPCRSAVLSLASPPQLRSARISCAFEIASLIKCGS